MPKLDILYTEDGSATLFVEELDEHYHSIKGALTEAEHIYRDCAFRYRAGHTHGTFSDELQGGYSVQGMLDEPKGPCERLTVLEIGFGTGLNAVVTAMAADASCPVHYISLEKYPVESALLARLGYGEIVDSHLFDAIHAAPWDVPVPISPHFTIEKRQCDFLTAALPYAIDVVYFDAFAPEKQPEMWSPELFARLYRVMRPGGVLTTYCAKGAIRRMLQSTGFMVERLAGPVGGKREILRATLPL